MDKRELSWAHVMRRDGVSIQHSEVIKLNKIGNKSTVIVLRYKSFVDTMQVLVHSADFFALEYCTKFVNNSTKYIVDKSQLSSYLPTKTQGTFNLYVPFPKIVIKKRFWEFLEALNS